MRYCWQSGKAHVNLLPSTWLKLSTSFSLLHTLEGVIVAHSYYYCYAGDLHHLLNIANCRLHIALRAMTGRTYLIRVWKFLVKYILLNQRRRISEVRSSSWAGVQRQSTLRWFITNYYIYYAALDGMPALANRKIQSATMHHIYLIFGLLHIFAQSNTKCKKAALVRCFWDDHHRMDLHYLKAHTSFCIYTTALSQKPYLSLQQ